ncbi:hypothetical protein GCM10023262_12960 [Bartonella pachyuromydis]|uniref:Uncharacterized protein n=1 Tax=Bartonella pachyuromydis TaxID=931097 RepID=A0ABP8VLU3_9HYPH
MNALFLTNCTKKDNDNVQIFKIIVPPQTLSFKMYTHPYCVIIDCARTGSKTKENISAKTIPPIKNDLIF